MSRWIKMSVQAPEHGQEIIWHRPGSQLVYREVYYDGQPHLRGVEWTPYPADPEPDEVTVTMTMKRNIGGVYAPGARHFEVFADGSIGLYSDSNSLYENSRAYIPTDSVTLPPDAPKWAVDTVAAMQEEIK